MPRKPAQQRKVECVNCGKEFLTRHSQGKFCSPNCRQIGARKNWRDYDIKNAALRKAYQRKKYQLRKKETAERVNKYRRTSAGKRAAKISSLRSREKFPDKYAARQAVLVALRNGTLVKKPCEKCGEKKVQGHHPDYSKPLYVIWLCDKHHREEHKPWS